jgi:ABC-2 type transport system ATP-binding protein
VQKFTSAQNDGYTDLTLILADESAIGPVVSTLTGDGASIMALHKREPTLEDVFVALVGHRLADEAQEDGA